MTSRRVQKAAQAIREVVSMAILSDLKDPRIRDITVTYVEMSGDLRQAKVHVSVMGDEAKQKLSLHGLQSAAGYLQSLVAKRIDTRYTPRLEFVLDLGVKRSIEISRILSEVLPAPEKRADGIKASGDDEIRRDDSGEHDSGEHDSGEHDSGDDEHESDEEEANARAPAATGQVRPEDAKD